MPNGAATRARLENYLLARMPVIAVRTDEHPRIHEMLAAISRERQLDVVAHSLSRGLREMRTGTELGDDRSLLGAIDFAGQQFLARQNLTLVFTDVQGLTDDNDLSRRFVDLATLAEQHGGCLVLVTSDPVWPRLARLGMAVTLDPPDVDEIAREMRDFLEPYRAQIPIEWGPPDYARAASVLHGITKTEVLNILATLVVKRSVTRADLDGLSSAKDAIFSDLAGIERVNISGADHRVGGLAGLRRWLERKRPLLTMDLRARGIRPPRGILLVGVPGCGKSLSAKAIAADWSLPLYRLDIASIFGQYVGQSETRFKQALATADTVAPCVLWIDEIEKGLAGTRTDSTGVTTRLVGQFLYWLQESSARVFVVATANDVRSLPQELLRSGRFDEMFFVDLPDAEERAEIVGIYWRKHLRVPLDPALVADLVERSSGFAGSDIAAAMAEVCHEAIRVGDAAVPPAFFRTAFDNVVPLSKSSPERIEEVRALGDRALPASGRPVRSVDAASPSRRVVIA